MSIDTRTELANEMATTRRAIAIYLKRLLAVEEKIDRFTTRRNTIGRTNRPGVGRGLGKMTGN